MNVDMTRSVRSISPLRDSQEHCIPGSGIDPSREWLPLDVIQTSGDSVNRKPFSDSELHLVDHVSTASFNRTTSCSSPGSGVRSSHRPNNISFLCRWNFEIAASVVSVASFTGLIILLVVSQGKQQQSWLNGKITLNGLIALITTINKASAMVAVTASLSQLKWNMIAQGKSQKPRLQPLSYIARFDSASRGPWGSLLLLWRLKIDIGLIGALITLSILAFDFFAQQATIIDFRTVPLANGTWPENVPRSESYNLFQNPGGYQSTFGLFMPDASAITAVYTALADPDGVAPSPLQCSTGNCTWPDVSSLAVCGDCTDISRTVTHDCEQLGDSDESRCKFHIPERNIDLTLRLTDNGTRGMEFQQALSIYEFPWKIITDQESSKRSDNQTSTVYNDPKVGYIRRFVSVDSTFRTSDKVQAHTCALWWCVQTYRTVSQNGVQYQTVIGEYSSANKTYPDVQLSEVPPEQQRMHYSNITGFGSDDVEVDHGVQFGYGPGATWAFKNLPEFKTLVQFPLEDAPKSSFYYDTNDTWAQAYLNIDDWRQFVRKVAMSITNNVRAAGDSSTPASRYRGRVLVQEAYVHVRWVWLIFPGTLVVASIGVLIACMCDTIRRQVPIWKDDPLALLFCQADPDLRNYHNGANAATRELVMLDTSGIDPIIRGMEKETGSNTGSAA